MEPAGAQEQGDLRRRVLVAFLQRLPAMPLASPATASLAERSALDLTASRLADGGDVAQDAHIFGPPMCRWVVSPSTLEPWKRNAVLFCEERASSGLHWTILLLAAPAFFIVAKL